MTGQRLQWRIAIVAIAVLAGVATSALSTHLNERGPTTIAGVQASICVGALLAIRWRRVNWEPFNPAVLFLFMFLMMYPLQMVTVGEGTDAFFEQVLPSRPFSDDQYGSAGLVALVGLLAFLAGWSVLPVLRRIARSKLTEAIPRPRVRPIMRSQIRIRATVLMVIGIALTGQFIVIAGGPQAVLGRLYDRIDLTAGLNYLVIAPLVTVCAAAARLISERRWPPSARGVAWIAVGLVLCIFTGSKANIIGGLLLAAVVFSWSTRRVTMAGAAVAATLLVVVASGYNLYFRDALPRNVPLSVAIKDNGGFVQAFGVRFVGNTFFGHQALVLATVNVPAKHDYFGFYSLKAVLSSPVPRRIYREKPDSLAGPFTSLFRPDLRSSGTTIPATFLGEWFLSFGVVGVGLGAGGLGFASRYVYGLRHRTARGFMLAAVQSAALLHVLRGDLLASVVFVSAMSLPIVLVIPRGTRSPMDRLARENVPDERTLTTPPRRPLIPAWGVH